MPELDLRDWFADEFGDADGLLFTRWLFLRGLAVVTFISFASFFIQYPGLIGEQGVEPLDERVEAIQDDGELDVFQLPTLSLLAPSNTGIAALAIGGMLLSLLLLVDVAPLPVLILLWLFHVSMVVDGGVFYNQQGDVLLTETLFLATLIAPRNLLPGGTKEPPLHLAVETMKLLLFKVMFFAGIVKVAARDPLWMRLTAMEHHFVTQTFPTPLAWLLPKLPTPALQLVTALVLVTEILLPILIFAPRVYRIAAAWVFIGFQLLIMATGAFGVFNLATIALCLLLFDDDYLAGIRDRLAIGLETGVSLGTRWKQGILAIIVAYLLVSSAMFVVWTSFPPSREQPAVLETVAEFETINRYGVFANMVTERPELIIVGSRDGERWRTYRFRYKPQAVSEPPPVLGPYLPRLDRLMWFVAHDATTGTTFDDVLRGLLRGSDPVEALFANDPFPDKPPRKLRVVEYQYGFTGVQELRRTGEWWTRSNRTVVRQVNRSLLQ